MVETATQTEERTYVVRLIAALDEVANSLIECRREGLEPADALRAAGIPIPSYVGPALNSMIPRDDAET